MRVRVGIASLLLPVLLAGCAGTADSGTAASGAAAGLPGRTERLAAACDGCHGPGGRGSGAVPALAGRSATLLAARLNAWRTSDDVHGADQVMVRFAHGLSADDVDALASHYARQAAEAPPARPGATR